jgi:tetratricopeptide (TPR) repeat protein
MKKVLIIFLLLLSFLAFKNIAYAQQEIDACWTFLEAGDYKRAIEVGKLAVKNYPKNPKAYGCLGYAYYKVGELNLALENLEKAESLTSNKEDLMYIYHIMGQISHRIGYLDVALLYYIISLSLAKGLGNTDEQAGLLNDIGGIYKDKGELDKALSSYEESLRLETNEKEKASIYNNIAVVYYQKGDYQKAVKYFQKAIEIDEKYGNYHGVAIHKLNLGDTYIEMKDYEKAKKYLFEGLEGVKKVGDKLWEATGYVYLGKLYRDKGNKIEAKEYFTRAYNLYKSIGAEGYAQNVLEGIKELDKSNEKLNKSNKKIR